MKKIGVIILLFVVFVSCKKGQKEVINTTNTEMKTFSGDLLMDDKMAVLQSGSDIYGFIKNE